MKKIVIAIFCLFLSVPAMAGGWTNWFTIDTLGYDFHHHDTSHAYFYVVPAGTVENPDSCTSTTRYAAGANHTTNSVATSVNAREISKLPTLAYTAGWQMRVYLNGCAFNAFPDARIIEIKKP